MRPGIRGNIQITLSGFTKDPKYQQYINTLKKLYCQEPQLLNRNTEILCTTTIHSEKCKIARVFKDSKIKIIRKEWMHEVHSKQKRVDTKNYEIKGLFYGLRLGLCGFTESERVPIIEKLKEQEGYAEGVDLKQVERANKFDCLLLSKRIFQLPDSVQLLDIPIVPMDWYQRCLTKNQYVFPNDNAINYDILTIRSDIPKVSKCAAKARHILRKVKLNDEEYSFFDNTVFFLHNFEEKPNREIKQIITAHGGFCIDYLTCYHTHIICLDYDEEDYNNFLKFGNNVKIVKLNWLFDCIITESMIPQDDYLFKKCKIKIGEGDKKGSIQNDVNSMSFNNRNSISMNVTGRLKKKSSISSFGAPEPLLFHHQSQQIIIQSNIFEKKKFFFYKDQYPKEHLKALIHMVKENSGTLPKQFNKDEKFILILPDSKDNVQKYREFLDKSFTRVSKISYRWIQYCVAYGQYIDPFQSDRFIFSPIMKTTPISYFLAVKCDLIGFNDLQEKRIKEMLKVIGASCDIYKKEKVTHVICNPGRYENDAKYLEYQGLFENGICNVKFVKFQWFLDNCNQIHEIPITNYLVQ